MKRNNSELDALSPPHKRIAQDESQIKQAILLQMKEYKRMLARSDDSLKTAKDILDSRNSHLSNVYSFISTLLVEISDIIGIDQDIESLDSLVFKCILDFHDSNSSQSEYSSLVVFDKIKNGILNLVKETNSSLNLAEKLHSKSIELSSTLPKLEIQIDENKRLHQELSDSKLLLLAAEKKIDRLENSNKKLKQEILDVSNSIRQEEKIIQQTPVESSGPSEFELLANSREVQIKKLQQERNSLSTLVDSFRLKSTETSETSSSSQSQALKIESLKKSNANLQERLAIIQENHQKFESERSKFKSIIAQELVSVRESHKKTMDKLESDISRVRSERDKAIASLSLQTATNALTTHQQQELRFLANSRRDRIKTLESEISRLKINLAQQMGERGLIEYFCQVDEFDGQEDGLVGGKECRGNPYAQQRLELSECKSSCESLKHSLSALENLSKDDRDRHELLKTEMELKNRIIELEKFENVDLTALQNEILDLKADLSASRRNSEFLTVEMKTICDAMAPLETRISEVVLTLVQKETQIETLLAEKHKEHKKGKETAGKLGTIQNLLSTSKKIMDKQNERLQQYSDAERLMTSQIQTLEKSVIAANAATIVHQQKLDDNIQSCKEHVLSIDKMSAKLSEYNLIFTEKTRDLQVEKAKHISLSEQIEVLNSKLLNLEKTDADAASAKQIFDLKKLLKCTSCDNNFKSHVLARCMHCFCKECIETVYESRQRKCPTCGIAFSREDMKQFYL